MCIKIGQIISSLTADTLEQNLFVTCSTTKHGACYRVYLNLQYYDVAPNLMIRLWKMQMINMPKYMSVDTLHFYDVYFLVLS